MNILFYFPCSCCFARVRFAGAWTLMLTTDGFYTFIYVQCSWLAFVRRFYRAYLIRDIHSHRLYRRL